MAPEAVAPLQAVLLLATLAVAVATDLRSRRIPNRLTLPALGAALLIRLLFGGWSGSEGLASGLGGALVAFAPFFLLASMGGMGMGDVKLAAAVGGFLGIEGILPALFWIAVAGGVQGAIALVAKGAVGRWLRRAVPVRGRQAVGEAEVPPGRITVPYGVAIACGTVLSLLV